MILLDANLLLYAHLPAYPQHRRTHAWLEGQLAAGVRVGLPWICLLAFLRLATNKRVFSRPLSVEAAWERAAAWLTIPNVWVPQPTADHAAILAEALTAGQAAGDLVPDAHLAALAIEHGLTLCSHDRDFARFPGLKWFDPLAAGP